MRTPSRLAIFPLSFGLMIWLVLCTRAFSADSSAQAEFRKICPGSKATTSSFDKRDIFFDSIVDTNPADKTLAKSIVYCLQISESPYEYVIEWPEQGLKNLATTARGYFAFRISHITRDLKSSQTTVYIGVNNTVFKPNVLKQQGEVEMILHRLFETIVVGSVPKDADKQQAERSQNLFPVILTFRAAQKDGRASLEYMNAEPSQMKGVEFEFSEEIKRKIPELSGRFSFGPKSGSTTYKVTEPVPTRTVITLKNADHQSVANMPVVIFLPSK